MATIDDLRKEIDDIDSNIMDLLDKRFFAAVKIGELKKHQNRSVLDSSREEFILNKTAIFKHSPQIIQVYKTIMIESKELQRK